MLGVGMHGGDGGGFANLKHLTDNRVPTAYVVIF